MVLADDKYFLEIETGWYIYLAVKDEMGNHTDAVCIDWDDLPDSSLCLDCCVDADKIIASALKKYLN